MKIIGFLYGDSKSELYYNMQVGSATIEGETTKEIIEKAQAIINSPFEAQKKYFNPTGARATEPFPLRMELTISGEGSKTIRKKKPRKREEKLRGGLDALIGRGRTAPTAEPRQEAAPTDERSAAEAYEEELLLMEKQQAPTDGAETIEEATPQEEQDLINSIEDEELRAALEQRRNRKRGRPRKGAAIQAKQDEIYIRSCWVMRRDQLAKLKEISFRETLTLREIMAQIVGEAIEAYEKKHGEVKPTNHKGDASTLFK